MVTQATSLADTLYSKIGFFPTPAQRLILESNARFEIVSGGMQGGKSRVAAAKMLIRIFNPLTCPQCNFAPDDDSALDNHIVDKRHGGLYWLVAADYERTRAEFSYLVEDFTVLNLLDGKPSSVINPGFMTLKDGTRIETKSAVDPRTLAMYAPNGIVACEASQLDMPTFERLRGRVAPRRGWLFLSGTLEAGSLGWYPQMISAWAAPGRETRSFKLPTWTNTYLFPGGRNDPEILRLERDSSDSYFKERIAGEPVPPAGIVMDLRPDIHIRDITFDPEHDVHIWVDPGSAGAYAVEAVQIINDRVYVFDEIYEQHLANREIIQLVMAKPWWKNVTKGIIDIRGGRQHHGERSPVEAWKADAKLVMGGDAVKDVNDADERLKGFLKPNPVTGEPQIVFAPKCTGVLSELGACPNPFDGQTRVYKWQVDRDGSIVGDKPDQKYNHGIRAITYGLIDQFGYAYASRHTTVIPVRRFRNGRAFAGGNRRAR